MWLHKKFQNCDHFSMQFSNQIIGQCTGILYNAYLLDHLNNLITANIGSCLKCWCVRKRTPFTLVLNRGHVCCSVGHGRSGEVSHHHLQLLQRSPRHHRCLWRHRSGRYHNDNSVTMSTPLWFETTFQDGVCVCVPRASITTDTQKTKKEHVFGTFASFEWDVEGKG